MKLHQIFRSGYLRMPVIILGAVLLSACGGGGGGGGVASTSASATTVNDNVVDTLPDTGSSQTETGAIDLAWTAPSTRADGTPLSLSDINGYRIYYGASAGNYPNRADVTDGTATSVTVTGVPVGTYYLVMTTYDVDGRESSYSSAVRKTAL